jgi:hypothetical protein
MKKRLTLAEHESRSTGLPRRISSSSPSPFSHALMEIDTLEREREKLYGARESVVKVGFVEETMVGDEAVACSGCIIHPKKCSGCIYIFLDQFVCDFQSVYQ